MEHNSIHSPKNKYGASVNFDRPVKGLGSVVSFTSDSIDDLKGIIARCGYKKADVTIRENRKAYPESEWVVVERYRI